MDDRKRPIQNRCRLLISRVLVTIGAGENEKTVTVWLLNPQFACTAAPNFYLPKTWFWSMFRRYSLKDV
ncbi:MAG: hypothetical protein R2911_16190 [Caldilineaceae bacterium]